MHGILGHARPSKLPRKWLLWGGLVAIAGAFCLAVLLGPWARYSDHQLLSDDGPSIVVMPFHAFGENGRSELGESIADGLAGELSQLPGAQIVSSKTARAYSVKSLDAHQIRRELGVAYIVEGSVDSARPGMHAEATLIETLHDTVVSAFTVDVAETDSGSARDNIVTSLMWSLVRTIIQQERLRAVQKPAAVQTANDLIWLAWFTFNLNFSYENSVEALGLLKKALSIDGKNPDALALMANVLIVQAQNYSEGGDHQSSLLTADALLTEALTIQPWHVLARYDQCLMRRAQTLYKEAIAVCRSLADDLYRRPLVYKEIGMDYVYLGKLDEAISAFTTADHLLKHAAVRWTWLLGGGWAHLQAGSYGEAIDWLRRVLEVRPHTRSARVWLIAAYALSGRQEDAAAELAELRRVKPDFFSHDYALAGIISNPGSPAFGEHMHSVIEGLERGGFPERMIKLLLAKTLIPARSSNSTAGGTNH